MVRSSFMLIAALATMQAVGVEINSENTPTQHELELAQKRDFSAYLKMRQDRYKTNEQNFDKKWDRHVKWTKRRPLLFNTDAPGIKDADVGTYILQYFNYPEYIEKSADEKMNELWAAIMADTTPEPFYWVEWGEFFNMDVKHAFKKRGDELPQGIKKLSHTQGLVAKVKWTPIGDANGYTGMFKTGMDNVIMRLSETGMLQEDSVGLMPSVAFKILRDGSFSDNVVAMPSFLGSKSWNFFENQMDTRVDHFVKDTCP